MKKLYDALSEYAESDVYPFHMPGHKRNLEICRMGEPYRMDITEIDGFDNLHDAKGILKNAMDTASHMYDAQETFFLVNGSSSGILSAVLACTKEGDEILIARNCHKSAYHALYLGNLIPHYLYPEEKNGISMEISPEDVEAALKQYPKVRAVVIVSPTYEGIVSDTQRIAKLAHEYGCPLIVDEAHGAHFGFAKGFPETAVRLGADLVIQSVHKTLPSFTQTALLHIGKQEQNSWIDRERLCRFLSIFQTSSPSYLLMAGIEKSLEIIEKKGTFLFPQLLEKIGIFRQRTKNLKYLSIPEFAHADPSKLVIFPDRNSGKNGHWLYRELLDRYHLQMEMESMEYVLAMTSIADTKEGFERLAGALEEIDQTLETEKENLREGNERKKDSGSVFDRMQEMKKLTAVVTIRQALDSQKKSCPLKEAEGLVSADYIYLYPPGIPLIVPGEQFTKELIFILEKERKAGLEVKGVSEKEMVSVV